jgi:hypothetical protein
MVAIKNAISRKRDGAKVQAALVSFPNGEVKEFPLSPGNAK